MSEFVLWEEIAREGAQAGTLLTAKDRIEIANGLIQILGDPHRLIFAAGLPAISSQETEIVRQVLAEVRGCQVSVHCRMIEKEIEQSLEIVSNSEDARLTIIFPTSEQMCQLMLHKNFAECEEQFYLNLKQAIKSSSAPIFVQLADVSKSKFEIVTRVFETCVGLGVGTIQLCDTTGSFIPGHELRNTLDLTGLIKTIKSKELLSVHFHNDFGLALANSLNALELGILNISASLLGLGERSGIIATEQLLLSLAYLSNNKITADSFIQFAPIDLSELRKLALKVAKLTNQAVRYNDPFIGAGVHTCSTGSQFNNVDAFRPFDISKFGLQTNYRLTHLASTKIFKKWLEDNDIPHDAIDLNKLLSEAKRRCYESCDSNMEQIVLSLLSSK